VSAPWAPRSTVDVEGCASTFCSSSASHSAASFSLPIANLVATCVHASATFFTLA
jgi:hypothetical protein